MPTGLITLPLLNMVASVLANVVDANNLSPDNEIEVIRHQLDELFVKYLDAYRKQTV